MTSRRLHIRGVSRLNWVLVAVQLALLTTLWTRDASAQFRAHTRGVVAIFGVQTGEPPDDQLKTQLETQFSILGWDVLFASAQAPAAEPVIAELYFAYGYNSPQPSMVTLKGPRPMMDPQGPSQSASVVWATLGSDRFEPGLGARVIALRAAELVRAGLSFSNPPSTPPEPEPEPVPQPPAPQPTRFRLGLAGGVVLGKSLGPTISLMPSAQFFVYRGWSLELIAALPLTENSVESDQGSADVRIFLTGVDAGYSWKVSPEGLLLDVALGGGAALLPMRGNPNTRFTVEEETVTTAMLFGSTRISYPIADGLRLMGNVLVGMALPAVEVRFDGERVAKWGQPMLGFGLGLVTP